MPDPTALPDTAAKPAGQHPAGVADPPPFVPGYEVGAEVGRGGMGVVYAARDVALDREVAVKTLQPGMSGKRFEREARITAKLPHPGVPPVYALGTLPDGRPFLAMKLIRGRTLDAELRARPDPSHDLPRFVQVFEQVCQAVGYAHARGVIHRDLKPANVMVGEFGEVQVMDWGLAKHLDEAGGLTSTEVPVLGGPGGSGRTADGKAADTDEHTRAGAAWGTPGYMPPEQAEGRWGEVDARADVYALGSVLCAVLTGEAAYRGPADAVGRLDRCGADAELVALAERCLAHDPVARPGDAGEVARAVAAYQAGVADRLRAAETERAAAEARAAEQRRRRRWQLAAAGLVGLLVAGGGAFGWWQDRQAERARTKQAEFEAEQLRVAADRDREREAQERQTRDGVTAAVSLAAQLRTQYRFAAADDAVRQAEGLLDGGSAADLRPVVARARADLDLVREFDDIRGKKSRWIPERKSYDLAYGSPAYLRAFRGAGLDIALGEPAALAARITSSEARQDLLDALDDWSLDEPDAGFRGRILAVLRTADPDPWSARLWDPAVRGDRVGIGEKRLDQPESSA